MNTWKELNTGALASNIKALRSSLAKSCDIIFVVKANAYGHGLLTVAREAWANGIRKFAVAHADEALAIISALPDASVIIAGATHPSQVASLAKPGISIVLADADHAAGMASSAEKAGITVSCHVKIDTGMGRLGLPWDTAASQLQSIHLSPGLDVRGICSHFACSDSDEEFTGLQFSRFMQAVRECEALTGRRLYRHIANSGAAAGPAARHLDAIRTGLFLYGYHPSKGKTAITLSPVLSWKTRIIQIKKVPSGFPVSYNSSFVTGTETSLATIDAGYYDGYPRSLGNRGIILAGGHRCRVAGMVTMNMTVIDLGSCNCARPGDEAVLIGCQGQESIWADELARLAGTIPYEILTNIKTDNTA